MTLLTICDAVSDLIPVKRQSTIVGNTNKTARLLLACANQAGERLAKRNWIVLQTEYTFQTADGTVNYSFPSDFKRIIGNTAWDRSNFWNMRGSLSPQEWQTYKSSVLGDSVSTRKRYRIRGVSGTKEFSIDPTPAAVEDLVYEYITANWCESAGGTGQASWQADTDTGVIDEYLLELEVLWRVLKRLGMEYGDEKQEALREADVYFAQDGESPILATSRSRRLHLIDSRNVPDTGFGQ